MARIAPPGFFHHVESCRRRRLGLGTIAQRAQRAPSSELPALLVRPARFRARAKHGKRGAELACARPDRLAASAGSHRTDVCRADHRIDLARRRRRRPDRPAPHHDHFSGYLGIDVLPTRRAHCFAADCPLARDEPSVFIRLRARLRPAEPDGALAADGAKRGHSQRCRRRRDHLASQSPSRPRRRGTLDLFAGRRRHLPFLLLRFPFRRDFVARHPSSTHASGGGGRRRFAAHGRRAELHRNNQIYYAFIGMIFFNSVFGMSYLVLMPVFARTVLAVGSQGFGFLQSAGGAGALIGVLAVAWFAHSRGKGAQAIFGAAVFGVFLIVFALSRSYLLSLTMAFLLGAAAQFYMTTISTILQVNLPNELRGRVMSIYGLAWELMPVGGMIAGVIAEFAGAPIAVGFGGAIVAGMAILVALFLPTVRRVEE